VTTILTIPVPLQSHDSGPVEPFALVTQVEMEIVPRLPAEDTSSPGRLSLPLSLKLNHLMPDSTRPPLSSGLALHYGENLLPRPSKRRLNISLEAMCGLQGAFSVAHKRPSSNLLKRRAWILYGF
jgi:hypothetical protein